MIRYLSAEQLQWIHRRVTEATGGNPRTRDFNLVQSSAVRPSGGVGDRDTYRTLPEKAAALLESLVLYHPFVDGNKRTALVATGIFLENNGHTLVFRPAAADNFLRRLAARSLPFTEVARWVEAHCVPLRLATGAARGGGPRRRPAARAGRRRAAR
jgi:death-on-curing protein